MDDHAKDIADWVDSHILLDVLAQAGKKLDEAPIPLIGRYYYNPETGEIEPLVI